MGEVTAVLMGLVVFCVAMIVGILIWQKSGSRKADEKAQTALQAALEPGEPLLAFTKVNTEGPSVTTAALTGLAGTAIASSEGTDLYVGLTPRRLILTPVAPGEGSLSVQAIAREDITGMDVSAGMLGKSTIIAHTRNGELLLHILPLKNWLRGAAALGREFRNPGTATLSTLQTAEPGMQKWKPKQEATLAPVLSPEEARQRAARRGRTTMLTGVVAAILGCGLTAASDSGRLYWGAILFGGIAMVSGLAQMVRARRRTPKPPDQMPWKQ